MTGILTDDELAAVVENAAGNPWKPFMHNAGMFGFEVRDKKTWNYGPYILEQNSYRNFNTEDGLARCKKETLDLIIPQIRNLEYGTELFVEIKNKILNNYVVDILSLKQWAQSSSFGTGPLRGENSKYYTFIPYTNIIKHPNPMPESGREALSNYFNFGYIESFRELGNAYGNIDTKDVAELINEPRFDMETHLGCMKAFAAFVKEFKIGDQVRG